MGTNRSAYHSFPARPWFGAWPPRVTKGEDMPIDSEGAVRKRAIRLWLILAIVVGYISIQIAKHATGWLQDVAENIVLAKLGEALLIAGILGLLVDEALKRELVR